MKFLRKKNNSSYHSTFLDLHTHTHTIKQTHIQFKCDITNTLYKYISRKSYDDDLYSNISIQNKTKQTNYRSIIRIQNHFDICTTFVVFFFTLFFFFVVVVIHRFSNSPQFSYNFSFIHNNNNRCQNFFFYH